LKLTHYNRLSKGGHFAAWEQPEIFSEELRAGFRPVAIENLVRDDGVRWLCYWKARFAFLLKLLLIARSRLKSRASLEAENLVLRQQVIVLSRKFRSRVRLRNIDRLIFVWLYRCFPSILNAITVVKPETVLYSPETRADQGGQGKQLEGCTREIGRSAPKLWAWTVQQKNSDSDLFPSPICESGFEPKAVTDLVSDF
jgi:hypothetical protein